MLNTKFSPWPNYSIEEAESIKNVLLSNKVNYWTGKECRKFEQEFALWSDVKYAVALANGTLALDAAFKALEISLGDEVIVTSRTYIATVSSIVNSGASPVFSDIDLNSQNISVTSIREKININTKAIVCVHHAGWPCEMDEIMEIAREFDLLVIEDCAQAHGAKYKGAPVGSIGHIGCWSFCQDKIMTTGGEGGMITTNNESIWRKIWEYKDHGKNYKSVYSKNKSKGYRFLHDSFGTNWRMTEIQAVIGRIQLKRMSKWHDKRLKNANIIWDAARKCKGIRVPDVYEHIDHAAYKCYIFLEQNHLRHDWTRDRVIEEINLLGVPCYWGTCSEVYLEKSFDNSNFRPKKALINAKKLGDNSLMFLVHPNLTKKEIQKTCDSIKSVMKLAIKQENA